MRKGDNVLPVMKQSGLTHAHATRMANTVEKKQKKKCHTSTGSNRMTTKSRARFLVARGFFVFSDLHMIYHGSTTAHIDGETQSK